MYMNSQATDPLIMPTIKLDPQVAAVVGPDNALACLTEILTSVCVTGTCEDMIHHAC